ncbi:hypothetical protein GGI07_001104 [Coemansia sp. Benny D115]|nr:hypothetical protein GGI07_001104 [Coemansia sp. Benny D115]
MQSLTLKQLGITGALVAAAMHGVAGLALPQTSDSTSSSSEGSASEGVLGDVTKWGFAGSMLSVARSYIAAASAGQYALFAGGRLQDSTYTDVVDIYDKSTGKWTVAHLSSPRSSIGAGSVGGRYAVFAGGMDAEFKVVGTVDVFDAETGEWSTLDLHTPRGSPQVLDLGDRAAVVGGLSGDLQYLSKAVDYIDGSLTVTNATLDLEYPQFGVGVADSARGMGLFTAGYQNNKPGERFNDFQASNQTTLFEITDSASVSASPGKLFPLPRWGAGGAAANGIFAIGGGHVFGDGTTEPLTTVTDRVDIYNAKKGAWNSEPVKMSVARDYPLVRAVGDYIVFLSGTEESKDFDVLDTRSGKFVRNLKHKPALYLQRSNAAAVTVDGCLLIVAGGEVYQGRNATASVEMFDACGSHY